MRTLFRTPAILIAVVLGTAAPAMAQTARPAPIVEFQTGYAGFIDESWIKRAVIGGAGRVFVSPRVAVGPEFLYLHASGIEHDWTLTGNVSFDLMRESPTRAFTPYIVAGAGLLSQTTLVGTGPYTSKDGTFSGGAGARIALGKRFFIAPEFRMGFEPEVRVGVAIGWRAR
jgi:hypothetical protein